MLGVCALHPEAGLTTDDLEEAHVKRAMVAASADVIALATADKLRAGSPYVVAPVAELTHLVAEAAAPDELLDPYRAARRHGDARMTPRWATTGVFVVNGAAIGTWVAQIPWVQERFDLSKSAMGLVILGMAIARDPRASRSPARPIVRHGSERMRWVGGIACVLAVNLPVLAPARRCSSRSGCSCSAAPAPRMDVAMNSHGVKVEKDLGRPIMSSLHAGWAFGGMAGAGFAARCARARARPARSPSRSPRPCCCSCCSSRREPDRPRLGRRGRRRRRASPCPRAASCCSPSSACS